MSEGGFFPIAPSLGKKRRKKGKKRPWRAREGGGGPPAMYGVPIGWPLLIPGKKKKRREEFRVLLGRGVFLPHRMKKRRRAPGRPLIFLGGKKKERRES